MRSASMIGIRSWFYEAEYPLAKAVTPSACTRFLSLSIFKPILYLFTVYNHVLCILYILSNKQVLQSTNVRLSMITHFFVSLQHSSSNILSIFLHAYISVLYATNTTIIFPPSSSFIMRKTFLYCYVGGGLLSVFEYLLLSNLTSTSFAMSF